MIEHRPTTFVNSTQRSFINLVPFRMDGRLQSLPRQFSPLLNQRRISLGLLLSRRCENHQDNASDRIAQSKSLQVVINHCRRVLCITQSFASHLEQIGWCAQCLPKNVRSRGKSLRTGCTADSNLVPAFPRNIWRSGLCWIL